MKQAELHNFLQRYFLANQCEILDNQQGVMTVQLTDELDETLMNRPFYWNYVKRVGGKGIPMKVTFITNPDKKEEKGEWIHFGSPRLHQIFNTLKDKGKVTKQYEKIDGLTHQTALTPWLNINLSIHYQGTHKRNEILSVGIHLITGAIVPEFLEKVNNVQLTPIIPDYCFTLTPIIRVSSALKRIEKYTENQISSHEDSWIDASHKKLQDEKELLDYFYSKQIEVHSEMSEEELEGVNAAKERYQSELAKLAERFEPKVSLEIINSGMFYFVQQTSFSLLKS
ncbi:YqhG family protein [Pontibacillus yanchengensis]|nr:YqhG family protein [Pontibacillus yanchengensis]